MKQTSSWSKKICAAGLLWILCGWIAPLGQAETLRVDFGTPGSPVASGYEAYTASHEEPSTFTPQSFSAFGTTVSITPTWAAGAVDAAMQMIVRGNGYSGTGADLLDDWIGTDTRQPGNPMTLTISGLPEGSYSWQSFHHDLNDQTGQFDVTLYDAGGVRTISNVDISNGTSVPFDEITTCMTTIISDGVHDIRLEFSVISPSTSVSLAFFVMNGFVLENSDYCGNSSPSVDGQKALLALVGRPVSLDVNVSDDGKPYIEGCDPADPQTGTAYPLEFQWLQQSGSGTVVFDPPSADQQEVTVAFPLQGRYELSLDVSDAPADVADRKTSRHSLMVEVVKPLGGDVTGNQAVNLEDLAILISQWLLQCPESVDCADLDNSGLVTLEDFSQVAANWMVTKSEVVISEFVASNRSGLADGDRNYSDWVELYNLSSETLSLQGWSLTDDPSDLKKWSFPANTVLPGKGYLVVFASGQDSSTHVDPAGYLHTNFALAKDGEYLALVAPDGRVIQEFGPAYPPQETDISYGLWFDLHRYFVSPTPMGANSNAFLGFTDKPDYSHERGFYDAPFALEITSNTPEAFIHYTLDGSEPTEQHGLLYDPDTPLQISTTTVVRSTAVKPGYRPGKTMTATFIFIEDVAQQPANPEGWPDTWGSEPAQYSGPAIPDIFADYEMDPRVVTNTLPGYSVQEALKDIPSIAIAMNPTEFIGPADGDGLWANPLMTKEYKCSIEYLPVNGSDDFQEDCKIENHGFSSRYPQRMQKHNLRLTFTGEIGASKLRHPLFPDSSVETFNQLILRAFSTDSWALVSWGDGSRYRPNDSQYIREVWMKKSMRDLGHPSSYSRYVHLYVNGLYFGLFDIAESVDEAFCAEHLGGKSEEWVVGKDFSGVPAYWNTLLNTDVSTVAGYEQSLAYIDVDNFIDYMLLHFYADVDDWPHHNGIVVNNTISGDGKMRFFVWDQEISLDSHGKGATKINNGNGVGAIFQKMRTSQEFRLLFADRVYKHCYNGGALSMSGSQKRYLEIANQIDKAIVAESARWGDTQMSTSYGSSIVQPNPLDDINHRFYPPVPNGPDYYFTREGSWVVERDNVINNYIPAIHDTNNSYAIVNVLRANNLYPSIDPPLLLINGIYQHGGHAETDDALTMVNPNGVGAIYYTLDGSDPRLPGGAVNGASIPYGGAVTLSRSAIVKARVLSGSTWSALAEAIFAVGPVRENLRITEMMYHPADPNTEFIELQNISATETINLNLVKLTKGIEFVFGDRTLAPKEYLLIVQDTSAFAGRYGSGLPVAGRYTGQLDNSGERITLSDAAGTEIQNVDYADGWYELTDGYGFSLTMVNPASTDPNDWGRKAGWRSSLVEGGTPGLAPLAVLPGGSIVINELLAHSHSDASDWIELRNTTAHDINIGGWFLSDDDTDPNTIRKYEIPPDTVIVAGGYHVFVQGTSFGSLSLPPERRFGLSEGGETVFLYSGQNGQITGFYQTEENFDASETAVTFGRYEKAELSNGYDFARMNEPTQGRANGGPRIPEIVITEIYYNPSEGTDYEFVELFNRSGHAVTLMTETRTETSPGVFVTESIPWRLSGIGFDFPLNTVVAAGERIIVAKNPAVYNLLVCDVYGPYDGKLDNAGEQIELQIPGDLEYSQPRYWIPIEKVDYDDSLPWPTTADGGGHSLHRLNANAYGRDYSNWIAAAPNPGI